MVYICKCDALYCEKCAKTLEDLENACWVCNAPFNESKPMKSFKEEEEKVMVDEKLKGKGEFRMSEVQELIRDYDHLKARLEKEGTNVDEVTNALMALEIETPSWGYGRGGTRFAKFVDGDEPTEVFGKLEEAAKVHELTGIAPSVALHIPWDRIDDYNEILHKAEELKIRIGAINPNLFQDQCHYQGRLLQGHKHIHRVRIHIYPFFNLL